MQEVDFYKLSRAVQDRFIASTHGAGEPRALLELRPRWSKAAALWAAGAALCWLAVAALVALGFGRLWSNFGRQPSAMVAAYALLIACAIGCALEAVVHARRRSALPYPARVYLFPLSVIDATTQRLRAYPLGPAARFEHTSGMFRVRTSSSPSAPAFAFPLRDPQAAHTVAATLSSARARAASAGPKDARAQGPLDPLLDIGVVNPFVSTFPLSARAPWWLERRRWVAALVALPLAAGVLAARNAASDRAMLRAAERDGRAQAYRAYLERGGQREFVRLNALPRAELADAVQGGSIAAIERFAEQHPSSPIQADIDAALRIAMLRELEVARASGTVAALRAFARAHQSERISAELRGAIHALYATALQRYRSEAPNDAQVLGFVERLFAYLEAHGPTVEVRFRRKASRSMAAADKSVKKSSFFMGTASLPSQYFDERRARVREHIVAAALKERFDASFARDLLDLVLGGPLDESESPTPLLAAPTIFIEHVAEVSGASYLSTNPRGVFVGLGLLFDVVFRIPGDDKPQKFRLSAWRPPELRVARKDDSFESAVYEAMASNGYGQFTERYLATFFTRQRPRAQN